LKDAKSLNRIWFWLLSGGIILLLSSLGSEQSQSWNPVEEIIVEITAPFQKLVKQTLNSIEAVWSGYFFLIHTKKENIALKKQVNSLQMENSTYRELLSTHTRLQLLLQFRQTISRQSIIASQVIGRDPTGWFKSVIIDKGQADGIHENAPVVNARGVVGRVVSVSSNYAKVLLLIDQNSAVDCLVQRSRARGMIKGLTTEVCKLDYVEKSSDVVKGDLIVTSSLGGVFTKGLPLGRVTNVREISGKLFKKIDIKPAVDFSKLEEVLVIFKEKQLSNHQIKAK